MESRQIFQRVNNIRFMFCLGSNRKDDHYSSKLNTNPNLENWRSSEGKKKLEESMRRLNVDDQRVKNKNLSNFGLDYLMAEKFKVKAELKRYDTDFMESFLRPPNRNEKEVMRPLYGYYKNLKNAIEQKQKLGGGNTSNTTNSSNSNINPGSNGTLLDANHKKSVSTNININNTNTNHGYSYSFNNLNHGTSSTFDNTLKNKEEKQGTSSHQNVYSNLLSHDRKITEPKNEKNYDLHSKFSSSDKELDGILLDNPIDTKKKDTKSFKDKKYSKTDILLMEKEYESIKKEQVALKQTLHNYQKEFYEIHNRRVKYYKDILGVENEYQKYKNNKIRSKEIQDILTYIKSSKQI